MKMFETMFIDDAHLFVKLNKTKRRNVVMCVVGWMVLNLQVIRWMKWLT